MNKEQTEVQENGHLALVSNLVAGDFIAFPFNYNGGEGNEVMVTNITSIYEDKVLCHFCYGHQSLSEFVPKDSIIAIGNKHGKGIIKGWHGSFDILKPKHPLLVE